MSTDLDDRISAALDHLAAETGGFEPDLDDVFDRVHRRRTRHQRAVLAVAAAVVIVAAIGGAMAGFSTRGDGSTLQVLPVAGTGSPGEQFGPLQMPPTTDVAAPGATSPDIFQPVEVTPLPGATIPTMPAGPVVNTQPITSPWWYAQTDSGDGAAHELPSAPMTVPTTAPPRTPSYVPLSMPGMVDIQTPTVGNISPGDVLNDFIVNPMLWVSGIPWDPAPAMRQWQSVVIKVPAGRVGSSVIIAYTADASACPDVLGVWGRLQSTGGWTTPISGPFEYGDSIVAPGAGRQRYDIPIGDDLVDGGALLILLRTQPSPTCQASFTVQTGWGAVPEYNGIHPAPTTTWG